MKDPGDFFLHLNDRLSLFELMTQLLILLFQGVHPLQEGVGLLRLGASPSRREGLQGPSFCLSPPGG